MRPSAEALLRIGEAARRAGVGVDALRFYEREGLIRPPDRSPSSRYRLYPAETVRTVRFIREAQALGFKLKEVGELLRLRDDTRASCSDVRAAAQEKLTDVERRIVRLRAVRSALRKLIDTCRSDGSTRSCPILESLTEGEDDVPKR